MNRTKVRDITYELPVISRKEYFELVSLFNSRAIPTFRCNIKLAAKLLLPEDVMQIYDMHHDDYKKLVEE